MWAKLIIISAVLLTSYALPLSSQVGVSGITDTETYSTRMELLLQFVADDDGIDVPMGYCRLMTTEGSGDGYRVEFDDVMIPVQEYGVECHYIETCAIVDV